MNNQPAFPTDIYFGEYRTDQHPGLTKREYFAAMALQGLLANPDTHDPQTALMNEEFLAMSAIRIANALITALEATK